MSYLNLNTFLMNTDINLKFRYNIEEILLNIFPHFYRKMPKIPVQDKESEKYIPYRLDVSTRSSWK